MERIKQYKEISKRPIKSAVTTRKDSQADTLVDVTKVININLRNHLHIMIIFGQRMET